MDYYYSIINFTNPSKVIFVGENFNHGPVWKAFERLQSFGMTKFDIRFQSSRFREDLVTILCARTMVESMSSLMTVTRLGFATRRFSMCCENHFPEAQQVYRVEPGKYNGGRHGWETNEFATGWMGRMGSTDTMDCISDDGASVSGNDTHHTCISDG